MGLPDPTDEGKRALGPQSIEQYEATHERINHYLLEAAPEYVERLDKLMTDPKHPKWQRGY